MNQPKLLQAAARRAALVFGARLTLQAAAGEGQRRFHIEAYNGGTLPVSGFKHPVVVDLTGLQVPANGVMPLLLDHEISTETTLGQTDRIVNAGGSLSIAGPITGESPQCLRVLAMSDRGQQWQASIGCLVEESQEIGPGQVVTVNGKTFTGPVIVARRAQLRETSVLPMGADATTSVNLAAAAAQQFQPITTAQFARGSMMDFESWLKSLGIDPATLTDEDKGVLAKAYDAKVNPNGPAPVPVAQVVAPAPAVATATAPEMKPEDIAKVAAKAQLDLQAGMRQTAAAELARQGEIAKLCVKHPQIAAKAIGDNWDVKTTEIAVLNARLTDLHTAPAAHIKANGPAGQRVLQAAFSQSRKLKDVEKQFTDQELQAAHTQFKGRIGLQQMVLQAAAANGYACSPGERITRSSARDVFLYAFHDERRPQQLVAAFSTVSLPGIFSNVANKELLEGYKEEDQTWREIAVIKSTSDLKAITSYRMLDNFEYEELGPAGEIKHGKVGEETYTRQAKLYAKMFALTLEHILNDDLSAFDDIKNRLGRGSAKKMNKIFWGKFMNNASFFTEARGNYLAGGTTNLATDGVGLQLGVDTFDALKSPIMDGQKVIGMESVGGEATLLLHPPQLATAAETLYKNMNLGTVKNSDANIWQGKYRPVKSRFLSDSNFTGYSAKAWYLFRPKETLAPMVVSFLDGQEAPTVEDADADFNTLGVQFRGWHGFGCDVAEYLAGIKVKGEA